MKSFCLMFLLLLTTTVAQAQVPLSGYFIAREECPAYQSIRNKTNPGEIMTGINIAYDLIGKNKPAASHYLIKMDAQPNSRWVAVSCGEHVVPVDAVVQPTPPGSDPAGFQNAAQYILAVSWQPGFCETKPNKPECQSQNASRFDASHFTLHGLWPQPRSNIYCNVAPGEVAKDKNRKWQDIEALALEADTREELNKVMPGTQSFLQRHEWVKHGSCYNGETQDKYFKDALGLMQKINDDDSKIRELFADNIGKEISAAQIKNAFEESFGDTAGDKIKIACSRDGNRLLITEITIGLRGNLSESSLREAILAAPNANNVGCSKGIVDAVGLQ